MAYKTAPEMFGDGGGFGPAVPYSTSNPPGTSAGNRGVQFGEQLTAAIANRTHYALALNTDDLNTRLAVFETGGLDAAYDNGSIGPSGGGREITKDGGAVETTSTLATQYIDDVANAHFRANTIGDTTPGGGFDYKGVGTLGAAGAYGYLSRVRVSPLGTYTLAGATSAVTLNPGGAGGDVVRFAVNVRDGSGNTDVAYAATDFLEITGAGAANGLYLIFSGGPTNADWTLRKLDGSAPAFGVNTAATANFFTSDLMTSTRAGWLGVGVPLLVGGTNGDESSIIIATRDVEGKQGVGPQYGIEFLARARDGTIILDTRITGLGRIKSDFDAESYGLLTNGYARDVEWAEGGLPFFNLNKSGVPAGYREIGILMHDDRDTFVDGESWSCAEYRHPIIESALLGINSSINGTFTAPMGRIILPDSDGAPAPPTGQFHSLWAQSVQPGATLVQILTGTGAGRYYLLQSIFTDSSLPATQDYITVTHLDGSALDVGELPTVGALTFRFYLRGAIGGRLQPMVVDTGPSGYTLPADVTPANFFHATATSGDPAGSVAAAFRGGLVGLSTADPGLVPGPYTLSGNVAWAIEGGGDFYTQGVVDSDQLVRASTGVVVKDSGDFTYAYTNDVEYYLPPITGISQTDAGGDNPEWYFDYTTGEWECISVALGARLWFPLLVRGQLRSVVWVSKNNAVGPLQDIALITETQDESSPFGKTVVASGTTSNGIGTAVQRNTVNFNTVLTQDTKDYYLRIQGATVGDRIRSLKVMIRKTRAGDGW